jgi:hypothetical protein
MLNLIYLKLFANSGCLVQINRQALRVMKIFRATIYTLHELINNMFGPCKHIHRSIILVSKARAMMFNLV